MTFWRRLRLYISTAVRYLHISYIEARAGYQGTRLGLLWLPLSTLIFTSMLALIFRHSDTMPIAEFFLYVLCGYTLWQFIAGSISGSTDVIQKKFDFALHNNLSLIGLFAKLLVDRLFEYAINVALVLVAIALLAPSMLGLNLLLAIPFLPLLIVTSLALAYIVNVVTVFAPDMSAVIKTAVRFIFFASPVFWSAAERTDIRQLLATYNPVAYYLGVARQVFGVEPFSLSTWTIALIISTCICLAGAVAYSHSSRLVTNIK
jgi:ABC-type polysaccharide/polyol phosphate export permease